MSTTKTVAVIGASTNRAKYGNKSVRAHAAQGYTVYPINPTETEIEGWRVYASIRDIPVDRVDRVTMYVLPHIGITLLEDILAKSPGEVWLNPGTESDKLIARAEQLGLPVIQACSIVDLGTSPAVYGA
jgi:uncharacterized protein